MNLKLAVQEHLIAGGSLLEKWERAQKFGFEAIELRGAGGADFLQRLPELRRASKAGVVFPTVCAITDRFIGDINPERRNEALQGMKTLLSVISELGGRGAITPAAFGRHSNFLPVFGARRNPYEDRMVLLEMLSRLADHARAEGVLVLLEPLNRYEDHILNTLGDGAQILRSLDHRAVKLTADFFHMSIEEDDIAEALKEAGADVAHVHLADSNRREPGEGHTDFASAFSALKEVGFDGFCTLECILSKPGDDAAFSTIGYMRRIL